MSAKLRVKCQKNDAGRLNWIEIWKKGRRKPLRLDFVWDANQLTREIEFSGSRRDMPSISDIMLMFNEGFIERIGLINLIKVIEEIRSVRIIGKDASSIERRSTISNNGTTPTWNSTTANLYRGKFFTRGCMGFIESVDVYCRDKGASGGTITVFISPNPSLGYVASATITVPAGGEPAWRSATFNRMWLSDKLFIFVVCSSLDIEHVYDGGGTDSYATADAGATWNIENVRRWFRVVMKGETEGDANVSGTVNTIPIPSTGTGGDTGNVTVPTATTKTVLSVNGAGIVGRLSFVTDHDDILIWFEVDGIEWDSSALLAGGLTGLELNNQKYGVSTPQIQLIVYNVGGLCRFNITFPIEFMRTFKVKALHTTGADQVVRVGSVISKLQ